MSILNYEIEVGSVGNFGPSRLTIRGAGTQDLEDLVREVAGDEDFATAGAADPFDVQELSLLSRAVVVTRPGEESTRDATDTDLRIGAIRGIVRA